MKKPEPKTQNVVRSNNGDNKITNLNLTVNDVTPLVLKIEEQEAVINEQKGCIYLLREILKETWKSRR